LASLPDRYRIALKCLGCLSSTTYTERSFSSAKLYDEEHRQALDWLVWEALVMLHHNRDMHRDGEAGQSGLTVAEAAAALRDAGLPVFGPQLPT